MRRWLPALAAGCSLLAGCYLTHPDGDPLRPRDSGPRSRPDRGFPPPPPDSSFDAFVDRWDAGRDGSRPRPDSGRRDSGRLFDGGPPRPDAGRRDAGPRRDAGRPDAGGPRRPALRFSRSTYFEAGDVPRFDTDGDSALELWVRSRETGDADFCQKGDDIARHLFAGIRDGRVVMGWEAAPTAYFVRGPVLETDVWTHLALVITAESSGLHTATLYTNGVMRGQRRGLAGLRLAFNAVGFRCGGADVDVDEIRVWRVGRSAEAIVMNRDARISGSIPGMIAYWRLDERGQIALDYTASGTVGILGRLTTPDPEDPTWISDGVF